jgi:ribosome biogenesis GTPase
VSLEKFGWNPFFEAWFSEHAGDGAFPARVTSEHRGECRVRTGSGDMRAEVSGRLKHDAAGRLDLPAVGDWVVCRERQGHEATIVAVLPRRSAFVRKAAGARTTEQVIAANVDTIFVVTGLDDDFNLRRIERYLTLTWESGARPVVVLNKADLCDDLAARVAEVERVAAGTPVVAVSAAEGTVEPLAEWLRPGETVALLGSSGVGKSTITNRLLGGETQRTSAVREHDARGRHTTTHRELFLLPSGALLVDTPGMRELQLWGTGEEGLREAFDDVERVARECRFTDCRHENEPGCAVVAAVEAGALDEGRLASYHALERELAHLEARRDQRLQLEQKRRWKTIHKQMRHHPKKQR